MPAEPKYIFPNGVLTRNPNYVAPASQANVPVAQPVNSVEAAQLPLAYVSSMTDMEEAQIAMGYPVQMPDSTTTAIGNLQSDQYAYLEQDSIIDNIGDIFKKYDIPMGLLSKLNQLASYDLLDFIIDDSASMESKSNVKAIDASEWMKPVIKAQLRQEPLPHYLMTRLQEAEDRLHIMLDILAYLPIPSIQIRFLNSTTQLVFNRNGRTPAEFSAFAHNEIRDQFTRLRLSGTPVKKALEKGFVLPGNVMHYLFNDGAPNEGGPAIAQCIKNRANPEKHPLTLISCSDNQQDTEWMKQVDGDAPFVAEIDDYQDEKTEVLSKQGFVLPYTRGMWLVCNLVAAICPYDLDALDENLPLTKHTLDELLGRVHSPCEYQYYFQNNPNAYLYIDTYQRFLTEPTHARGIISEAEQQHRERIGRYTEGRRPNMPLANIAPGLEPITQQAMRSFSWHNSEIESPALPPTSEHPSRFFQPPPPPSYEQATNNSKMGLG